MATVAVLGIGTSGASAAVAITGPASVAEGDSGTKDVTYTLTRTGTTVLSATAAVTVTIDPSSTATCSADAAAADVQSPCSASVMIAPGLTGTATGTVTFKVVGDTRDEPDETIVAVATATGDTVSMPGRVTTTITDDDVPPTVTVGAGGVSEGTAATPTTLALPLTLSAAAGQPVTVSYTLVAGTAGPDDLPLGDKTVVIPAGQKTSTIIVPVIADSVDEDTETFTVTLTGATGATLGPAAGLTATGTITDDDTATVAIADVTAQEKTGPLVFPVTLTVPSSKTVTVNVATADGNATAPADYAATSGTLSFAPGETSKTVSVPVVDDAVAEPDEYIGTSLSGQVNASLGRALAAGIILNDDGSVSGGGGIGGGAGSGTTGSGGSGGGGSGGGGTAGGDDTAAPDARLSAFSLRKPATLTMKLTCPADEVTCKTAITVFTTPQPKSKVRALRKEIRLGRAMVTLAGGETRTVTIKLTSANARTLKLGKTVKATAFAVTRDAPGNIATTQLRATLKA